MVANQTLWFLLHGLWDLPRRPRFDRHWHEAWSAFEAVNRQFAEAVAADLAPGATVLIHDYQLALVGAELRRLRPDVRSSVFIHTPFCHPAELDVLPDGRSRGPPVGPGGRRAPAGFTRIAGPARSRRAATERRVPAPETFVSPAAVDAEGLTAVAASAECDAELACWRNRSATGASSCEPTASSCRRTCCEVSTPSTNCWRAEPAWRGRVIFGAFVYPSRESLADYLGYRQEVEAVVRMVNAKWATADWTPILLDMDDNYPRSVAALRRYDVLWSTLSATASTWSPRKGRSSTERDGVLLLSPGTGAWDELGAHAVETHPFDIAGTADALATALEMGADERAARAPCP